jgi:hypothetical protein
MQVTEGETAASRKRWLYRIGGVASLLVSALFLIGLVDVMALGSQPAAADGPLTAFPDNWLVVLFKLNAGLPGVQPGSLNVVNPLDLGIMALFCVLFLALAVALRPAHRVWPLVAAALPFLGIPLFLATGTAGRSTLLVGGLIMSAAMLPRDIFSRASACAGIAAAALLFFAGDLGTAIFSSSPIIAALIGIGYVLWVVWFFLIARTLFGL